MKSALGVLLFAFFTTLSGCAIFQTPQASPGESESTVLARLGQPTHRYQDGQQHLLEYATGPWGQQTYMVRIGANGKVISFEQVLTTQKFASINIGQATKDDVLRTIGAPSETTYLPLSQLEVWSYPYRENGVWDSMMHVHFDKVGIVRQMMNAPDLRRDPDTHWPLGMLYMQ